MPGEEEAPAQGGCCGPRLLARLVASRARIGRIPPPEEVGSRHAWGDSGIQCSLIPRHVAPKRDGTCDCPIRSCVVTSLAGVRLLAREMMQVAPAVVM